MQNGDLGIIYGDSQGIRDSIVAVALLMKLHSIENGCILN
jgi:hypothetical protein